MTKVSNEEIVKKAMITAADIASSGKMNPVQSNTFLDYVYDMTQLRNMVRLVRFTNESMEIDKIAVHSRVAILKSEARSTQILRGITTSKVTLRPVDLTVPWEISDNFADFSIEGEQIYDTVMRMMATQAGNDVEEQLIDSNTLGPARLHSDLIEGGENTKVAKDTFLSAYDGWLRLADSGNIADAEGADISSSFFSKMIRTMPRKFRRIRRDMRFLVSMDHEQLYRERKGARQTAAGDEAESSTNNLKAYGIEVVPVPLLDSEPRVVEHVTLGVAPATITLAYAPISPTGEFYATNSTLSTSPTTPYIPTTDYTINRTTGVFATVEGAGMAAGGTYKITYQTQGQALLTDYQNLIMAIGRDIRLEQDRDKATAMNQFYIHARVYGAVEEVTAIVKGINIGLE